ncbi:hypothetical protein ATY41_10595 [Leifsonia xyli subsp. xyli]|uniref:ATP-dependent DNA ligase family profile domain-containing protein n=1 Tax=Leifsonia xyli subsp. xyli TaxID=59736 RepID=A0A1E2SKP6_LEIXY|nr:hypothetical protein ATY41_10595 [Leifsonia xyli subsp. xyli]
MLARAVPVVPDPGSASGGLSYEPKWDGFRAIVYARDAGDRSVGEVETGSRGSKTLTRYFPELVNAFRRILPGPCVLDGEIVVPTGDPGSVWIGKRCPSASITPRAG